MAKGKKIRVNVTVDKELLDSVKKKLRLFGGKLSTLFNALLIDFVDTMGKEASKSYEILEKRIKEIEESIKRFEGKFKK